MRYFFIFLAIVFLSLFTVSKTFAHFKSVDGNIKGVLHMDPDDEPIAGAETYFHIDIVDSSKRFSVENCDCVVKISKDGEELFSYIHTGSAIGLYDVNFKYQAPGKGVYTLQVNGKPKSSGQFDEFKLEFNARFEKELSQTDRFILSLSKFRSEILFLIVGLCVGFVFVVKKINRGS